MQEMLGKSGKYYVKNPHGGEVHAFTIYESEEAWLSANIPRAERENKKASFLPIGTASKEVTYQDFGEEKVSGKWEFTILAGTETIILLCDLEGNLDEPKEGFSSMSDLLDHYREKFGSIERSFKLV